MNAQQIIEHLQLVPHPGEGGYFRETYRSQRDWGAQVLPEGYGAPRAFSTAIYYLLTPETFSAMHEIQSDEIFHFYLGNPVEMLHLYPDGHGEVVLHGSRLEEGMHPQVLVPGGVWQGARLLPEGTWALMGTTVAPGFDFADFEVASRLELLEMYPDYADQIRLLTRE